MPMARRGPRAIAAPSSVPPTPANGSSTSSPVLVKNSMSRAMSRGGLFAPWALRRCVPQLRGVGRRPDRLREVEPLLAGELVEVVGGVGRAARLHPGSVAGGRADARGSRSYNASMPGRVVSRRFIGREPELARIADALATAAGGDRHDRDRRAAAPGWASRGSSTRRSSRAAAGPDAAAGPARPRHGPADPPWAAVLEALEPRPRHAPAGRGRWPCCGATPARSCASCHRSPRSPTGVAGHPRQRARGPGAPPAARAGGAAALAGPPRRRAAGGPGARGPPRRRCRDPGLRDVRRPDRPRRADRARALVPARPPHARAPAAREPGGHRRRASGRPSAWTSRRFARREIAGLIEGIEGERPSASIVVLVAERSGGLAARRGGAGRRPPRAAQRDAHRDPRGPRRRAAGAPLARVPPPAPAARPRGAPGDHRGAGRSRRPPSRPAPARRACRRGPPRCRGAAPTLLDADLAAGLAEALEHGFVRRDAGRPARRSATSWSRGPSWPTCCPRSARATGPRSPTPSPDMPAVAAAFWRGAHRLDEAREAAIEAGRLAMRVEAPQDALARPRAAASTCPPARPPTRRPPTRTP